MKQETKVKLAWWILGLVVAAGVTLTAVFGSILASAFLLSIAGLIWSVVILLLQDALTTEKERKCAKVLAAASLAFLLLLISLVHWWIPVLVVVACATGWALNTIADESERKEREKQRSNVLTYEEWVDVQRKKRERMIEKESNEPHHR